MAKIHPVRALRYTELAGPISDLATLPYDVIPAALEAEYKGKSAYNFAHLILPRGDYAGAKQRLDEWTSAGALAVDAEAAVFVYEQTFPAPYTGEVLVRRGFIALCETEDYGRTVYRHERTISGPKKTGSASSTPRGFSLTPSLCSSPMRRAPSNRAWHGRLGKPDLEYTTMRRRFINSGASLMRRGSRRSSPEMADAKLLIADGPPPL